MTVALMKLPVLVRNKKSLVQMITFVRTMKFAKTAQCMLIWNQKILSLLTLDLVVLTLLLQKKKTIPSPVISSQLGLQYIFNCLKLDTDDSVKLCIVTTCVKSTTAMLYPKLIPY